jgi:nickel transport protein
MRRPALAALLTLGLTAPALAHRVVVFASVEADGAGGEVVVEAKFSTGRVPALGEVQVRDAAGALLATYPLEDGGARFPLDRAAAAGGLEITVTTGDDHEGYWLLTPADLAGGGS